ncbi:hypothetical protein F4805DRAFT_409108 [Annulohypoxylon moriforme]|nr:hypothetical protein F4805DRAFT_409108 [Annulohypoxylon moriforme]
MGSNGRYPGGMPPYQPYPPYQQSYQQQGYQQPLRQPEPPSPRTPQLGEIITADGRPHHQASPTRMHGPYMSGGLSTEPSPEYYFRPYVTYLVPPQPQVYLNHDTPSSLATEASDSSRHFGSSFSDLNLNDSPRPKPRAVSPTSAAPFHAPDPHSIHQYPKHDPYPKRYDLQADSQPEPKAASHHHRSGSYERTRPTLHRSNSGFQPKSILKKPAPQIEVEPESKPKPKTKHHHHHHRHHRRHHSNHHSSHHKPMPTINPNNPLAPALLTEQELLLRGQAELDPLTRAILEVVTYEFALPASNAVDVSFSLAPIDLDPPTNGVPTTHSRLSWGLGTGILHTLTGSRIFAPLLTITLPPRYEPVQTSHYTQTDPTQPVPEPDHGIIAACERVVASLRYGTTSSHPAPAPAPIPDPSPHHHHPHHHQTHHQTPHQTPHATPNQGPYQSIHEGSQHHPPPSPNHPTLPFRVGGDLFGSSYVFRVGAADSTMVLGALAWVYLPCAGREGLGVPPVYSRVEKDGREGRRQVRRWAEEWGVVDAVEGVYGERW